MVHKFFSVKDNPSFREEEKDFTALDLSEKGKQYTVHLTSITRTHTGVPTWAEKMGAVRQGHFLSRMC